jgi:microcystin degradation protein MlrC
MRIAIAEIGQETDTFNPLPTTLQFFKDYGLYLGDKILEMMPGVGMLGGFLEVARQQPETVEIVPIIRAWAGASGPLTAETLEYFEATLVTGLQRALPLDGLFLALHGAAVSAKDDDLEGYLLSAVRRVIGPQVPIVSPLDHHANITQRMVEQVDLLVGFQTQPHDHFATGQMAARLFFPMVRGAVKPTVGWRKIPMITPQDQFLTAAGPMKVWFDLARAMETRPGVLTASPFPMQPWLDVQEGGWAAVVYTDNDPVLAQILADELANQAWALRDQFWLSERVAPEEAVCQAVAADAGLVILADTGDSVYGGASGDSPCLLRALLAQNIPCPAFVPMLDPVAQAAVAAAGIGAQVTLPVGAKQDTLFNQPLEITGQVTAISKGLQVKLEGRGFADIGPTALVEIGHVKLVLMGQRGFAINQPILYTHLGLEMNQAKMVVVKTASNFQFFAPWRKALIRVDSPGMTQSNLAAFSWRHLPRPIYPLDELPVWRAGDA